jgi:lysophospholipase L1-like esterase
MHPSLWPIAKKMVAGTPLTTIAFGTDITAGCQIDPECDESIAYHNQWLKMMGTRYPAMKMKMVTEGHPGATIDQAHERVKEAVLMRNPSLVILEFGINDSLKGPAGIEHFDRELKRLVRRIQWGSKAAVILMTVNCLNSNVDPEILKMAPYAERTALAQNSGWVRNTMNIIHEAALDLNVALAEGYETWERARRRGTNVNALLANSANHPNAKGHSLLADALLETFT